MNVCIISASSRAGSNSRRLSDVMNAQFLGGRASVVDLFEQSLPLWDGSAPTATVEAVRAKLNQADAFVMVVPEWHGMAPAALRNFFLWFGAAELAHKPTLLVAVSGAVGGAMIISELRGSAYKNARVLYLPEHLILRDANDLWNGIEDRKSDGYLAKRAEYALAMLETYTQALAPVRAQLCEGLADFPNGMS